MGHRIPANYCKLLSTRLGQCKSNFTQNKITDRRKVIRYSVTVAKGYGAAFQYSEKATGDCCKERWPTTRLSRQCLSTVTMGCEEDV